MLLPMFAAALLISAVLLFWMQPLFGKMALPLLGGSASVWTTALMFFQAILLAGYAYAHVLSRVKSIRLQVLVHAIVLLAAFISLPITISSEPASDSPPILWLLGSMATTLGIPFFAISATAPLLQRWFSLSRHPHAQDPYFLYSISNLGSVAVLLAYPFIIEPLIGLDAQSLVWTFGYGGLLVLIMLCGLQLLSSGPRVESKSVTAADSPITWRQRFYWVALTFAPSSLLLGVTTHLTTDVAAAPLLWIVPLILYLVTYIIAFARRRFVSHPAVLLAQPFVLLVAFILLPISTQNWALFSLHLVVFFILALGCHGELVRRRPPAAALTEFYFAMGIGGALGGLFNAVIAPLVFVGIYEYGLAIVIACMLRPQSGTRRSVDLALDIFVPVCLLSAVIALAKLTSFDPSKTSAILHIGYLTVLGLLVLSFKRRPIRFGLGVGAAILGISLLANRAEVLARERSFFGVYRVEAILSNHIHLLKHGTTLHGIQDFRSGHINRPQGYYARQGPLGQIFETLVMTRQKWTDVGLVGLGAGATLCYALPSQAWTVFEIDPMIVEIARDPELFTYWAECADRGSVKLVLGDARLTLRKQKDQSFDSLIIDAYNSDAVPVHLLTREAVELYLRKIRPDGLLLFHLSNRYMKLAEVLGAVVKDLGLTALWQTHEISDWAIVAPNEDALAFLREDERWQPLVAMSGVRPWTDDFSDVVSVIKWGQIRSSNSGTGP